MTALLGTGFDELDKFLKGGIPLNQCIEFCGLPGGDTAGVFPIQRLQQLCTDETILSRILTTTTISFEELSQAIKELYDQCKLKPVPLIVIDNICIPSRAFKTESISDRVAAIRSMGLDVRRLLHHGTVLVTNHLTSRFIGDKTILIPALGDSWAVMIDLQILVEPRKNFRVLTIVRSDHETYPLRDLFFEINQKGIMFQK